MRIEKQVHRGESIPARSWVLIPAATTCGLLWIGAVLVASFGAGGPPVIVLGATGLLLTAALLLLIQNHHSRLRGLAETDPLTGLVNHRGFHQALPDELQRAATLDRPLAVVALDLDNFKWVNDNHGHPYGDRVLRQVGTALRGAIRNEDIAARVGGEEFALILPGADSTTAFAVAERARIDIAAIPVEGLELGCSGGVAAFPADAGDASTLCQLADSALYWAKRGGKRRTRRFDPDHSPANWNDRQRAEIESLLEAHPPITAQFQPVVSLATGRVVGYEALARFTAGNGRTPDVWFAQAHGCGLGAELEAAAIEAALAARHRPLEAHLAINVSPSALGSEAVQATLHGDLHGIVIEITEHEFVPEGGSLAAAIADLRRRGARIAIDDAGAGHAGLTQLMRVRPDIVKLDHALIRDIDSDVARMALVESFVRFARNVGATVCAEGIETLGELEVLADLDVQWGQGFALARPAPAWPAVAPEAVATCRTALAETFRSLPSERDPIVSGDRRLVHLSAQLASTRSREELERALALIADELSASSVCLSVFHGQDRIVETLAESGHSDTDLIYPVSNYPLTARVLDEREAAQVVVSDPASDPSEVNFLLRIGKRSMLMVPIVCRGESLGILEAFRDDERAWSRGEINRARVIANQFASLIPSLLARDSNSRVESA
jgi:diguanylate cyclase (GGDEF)-like protein